MPTLFVVLELRESYPAEQIGHFRAFCSLYLKEIRHGIVSILFGSTDKQDRLRTATPPLRGEGLSTASVEVSGRNALISTDGTLGNKGRSRRMRTDPSSS